MAGSSGYKSSSLFTGSTDYISSRSSQTSSQSSPLAKAMGLDLSPSRNSSGISGIANSQTGSGRQGGFATATKVAVDTGANLAKGVAQVANENQWGQT